MRRTWAALLVAAVGAAVPLAGCGIELSSNAAPATKSPAPSSVPASPSATPSPSPSPSPSAVSPAPETPAASPTSSPAEAAARRRIEAAAKVGDVLPSFDRLVADMVARSGVPGAAVAVVAGDRAVYVRCFGTRAAGEGPPVDKDTVFQLGPVTRTFTTGMLAGLVTDGDISWDEPVVHDWPGFHLWGAAVSRATTYRDLTAERTGLPPGAGEELLAFGYGRAEILRRLRHLSPSDGFRTTYAAQTAAFTAAAVAAEKATGEPWARLVRSRLLRPLGMDSVTLTFDSFRASVDRATPHLLLGGTMQPQRPADRSAFAPESGAGASVGDLVPFVRFELNGGAVGGLRVASTVALREAQTPAVIAGVDGQGVLAEALGWRVQGYDGRVLLTADGDLERGSGAFVALTPDDGVGVVVLANSYPEGGALGEAVAKTLLDLYVEGEQREDWLSVALEKRTRESERAQQVVRRLPEAPPVQASRPRARTAYEGTYANAYYGEITVRGDAGNGLKVRLGRGETVSYVPWDGDTWCELASHTAAVFEVEKGRAVGVRLDLLDAAGCDGLFQRR